MDLFQDDLNEGLCHTAAGIPDDSLLDGAAPRTPRGDMGVPALTPDEIMPDRTEFWDALQAVDHCIESLMDGATGPQIEAIASTLKLAYQKMWSCWVKREL